MINEDKIVQKNNSSFYLSEFSELTSYYFIYHNIDQYVDIYLSC